MTAPSGLYTIPPGAAFVDALAAGILDECAGDPLVLADYLILLPTRRACRALREAFLRVSDGQSLVLPAMRPIGDVDVDDIAPADAAGLETLDLPPALSEQRRLLLLARLILRWNEVDETTADRMTPDHAVRLAQELARLIDQVQTERLSFDGLAALAPREYAQHWERTLDFLKPVTAHWPDILAEESALDPADRRNRLLEGLAARWEAQPPAGPVIAAGSTGSVPASADLFAVIAALPQGRVVLPGLDREADAETWAAIGRDQTHPQFGLAKLLDRLGLDRAAVQDWPSDGFRHGAAPARTALAAEALRPAETTDAWRDLSALRGSAEEAFQAAGESPFPAVQRIVTPGDKEEAEVIALMLRHSLETPERTAALVTADRRLARRVAASLRRWGIVIDDSAGQMLSETPPGVFLRLVAEMVFQDFAPVATLAACKHPLAAAGMAPADMRRFVRALERWVLRGPTPDQGLAGLRQALAEAGTRHAADRPPPETAADIDRLLDRLEECLTPLLAFRDGAEGSLQRLVEAHVTAAEALAADGETAGAARLWSGEAGEALAVFVNELHEAADALPMVPPDHYPEMVEALMLGNVVRPNFGRHPRLNIWGPLEARLQHADLIILGGLNEGNWPADPGPDPWMSRPMRDTFGLPLPERRIGLAAHDFAQLFCAPEIVLSRAQKSDGTPTVPSRWLLRLETVLEGCGLADAFVPDTHWPGLEKGLVAVERHSPVDAPAPRPPVEARPRRLSVTRIETWMRDPYSIYARHILGLRPLDPLEASPGAADRGTIIHDALDAFVRAYPDGPPDDALPQLLALGETAFGATLARPAVRAFWWPRFVRIAEWFIDVERKRRAGLAESRTEVSGTIAIDGAVGPFTLTAKADRIDRSAGGSLSIIDYKTGLPPSERQLQFGYAPQLPLEAAIAEQGGFEGVSAAAVDRLAYWRLSGGDPAGQIREFSADVPNLTARVYDNLVQLIDAFDRVETPYLSTPEPEWPLAFPEYDHLARLREWSGGRGNGS